MKRNTYYMDEVVTTEKVDVKYFKRLLSRIVPYKKLFLLSFLLLACSSLVSLLPPFLIRAIVNDVIPMEDGRTRALTLYIVALAALGVLTAVLPYFHQRIMGTLGHRIISEVRREIFVKLQELPFEYYDNRPAGKISIRVTEYVNELADFFTDYLLSLIVNILKIVAATVFMLCISPILTGVIYAAAIPLTVCVYFIKRAVRRLFRKHRAKNSNRNAFIVESIMGEKVIKSNNRSAYNRSVYKDLQEDSAKTWMQIVRRNELNAPVSELCWNAGILGIYAVALALIGGGATAMAGTVIAFTLYVRLFTSPLSQLAQAFTSMQSAAAASERVFEFLEEEQLSDESGKTAYLAPENVRGDVTFEHVRFGYDEDRVIIHDFSAEAKAGQKIAIVGPTGAGKTTMVNLLMRFYEVNGGCIKIDGIPTSELTRENVHDLFCMVLQDTWLFDGTIRENVVYSKENVSDEEVVRACKAVGLDHFVRTLPHGYDTVLDDKANLSAGQKQLVTIARAMIENAPMLILDEATSSVDTRTEELIQKAMDQLTVGRTSFIIAHRLSTIRNADLILVMKDGDIIEKGSHEQLLSQNGFYAELYNSQFEQA